MSFDSIIFSFTTFQVNEGETHFLDFSSKHDKAAKQLRFGYDFVMKDIILQPVTKLDFDIQLRKVRPNTTRFEESKVRKALKSTYTAD